MRLNQTEPTGPRLGVLVVFVALAVVLMTVWFRESETGPLHRVRLGVQAATAPVSAAGEFVTRPVRGLFSWASDLGVSRSQLEQLRSQNESLRTRVAQLEEARQENIRLRALLKLAKSGGVQSKAARVIGRPTNSWEGIITIDLGSKDGITVGMPVVGPRGLLGQTVEVASGSARVRLITDQRSGVAAMVQRNRAVGILKGTIEGRLDLDFISRETTVKPGDVVITSGLGGVYPKGIVIGEVAEVDKASNTLYQSIRVEPSGDISGLEEVLVLIGEPKQPSVEGGE